jgi:predicted signal transduction protein with EAL and GGDEF domain
LLILPPACFGGSLTGQILQKTMAVASVIPDPLTRSVNISPLQLHNPHLSVQIHAIAAEAGLARSRLGREITESALVNNLQNASKASIN